MKQTNFEKHQKRVKNLCARLFQLDHTAKLEALDYHTVLRNSRLTWSERGDLCDALRAGLKDYERRSRPEVLEGGALVSRRSTARLTVVAS
jgi:hypothetical protein